jgi:mono/diheme cytochrome c family protein
MFFSVRFIPSITEEISLLMATAAKAGSKVKIFMLFATLAILVTPAFAESHATPEIEIGNSKGVKVEIEVVEEVKSLVSYTSEQAKRGKKHYEKYCAECHGKEFKGGVNGGPVLRGVQFLETYANGAPASWLFEFMYYMMPPDQAGRFSIKKYTDMMAYILKKNGFKSGEPLPSDIDALENLIMEK